MSIENIVRPEYAKYFDHTNSTSLTQQQRILKDFVKKQECISLHQSV